MWCCVFLVIGSLLTVYVRGEILVEPGPGPILTPVGDQALLTCSVTASNRAEWSILLPDMDFPLITDQLGIEDELESRGFTIEGLRTTTSTLTSDQTNNQTVVRCLSVDKSTPSQRIRGTPVLLTFFGVPPAPSDVRATENGLQSLNVSWSLSFIEGVVVNYTLTAINLNDSSSSEAIVVTGIQEQNYIFTVPSSSTSCDFYSFQVTAINAAGAGDPSEVITRSLPSLPDISAVEESLSHSLMVTGEGIQLTARFQDISQCPDYHPIMNYTLIVEDVNGERVTEATTGAASGDGQVTLTAVGLTEDSQMVYYIVASNQFGASNGSAPVEIVTTDVQGVSLCSIDDTTYAVSCTYLNGSSSRGCTYTLTGGSPDIQDLTGTVERSNDEGEIQIPNLMDYTGLRVVDLESANSSGNVSITGSISDIQRCPVSVEDQTAVIAALVIGISLAVLLILVASVLALLLCVNKFGHNRVKRPLFAKQRSSGSYTVNNGQYQQDTVEMSVKVEPQSNGVSASSDVQYAVPCVKTSSTSPTVHSQDDSGFCFQDPSYEILDQQPAKKAPAPKRDPKPVSPTPPLCPSGGDSPVHSTRPVQALEYAVVIPKSQRMKKAQQQQQQQQQQQPQRKMSTSYVNCDVTANSAPVHV